MITCQRCRRQFSCSCNSRVASNGTPCCSSCINQLEQEIAAQKQFLINQSLQNPQPPTQNG